MGSSGGVEINLFEKVSTPPDQPIKGKQTVVVFFNFLILNI